MGNNKWISVTEALPFLSERNILVYYDYGTHGEVQMVRVESYFSEFNNGFDENGNIRYSKWYLHSNVTHWQELPNPPKILFNNKKQNT